MKKGMKKEAQQQILIFVHKLQKYNYKTEPKKATNLRYFSRFIAHAFPHPRVLIQSVPQYAPFIKNILMNMLVTDTFVLFVKPLGTREINMRRSGKSLSNAK